MRQLRHFFNGFLVYARRWRRSDPRDIPKKLPPEALAMALAEARFLSGAHGVDVVSLAPGEKPESPRVAYGEEPPEMP